MAGPVTTVIGAARGPGAAGRGAAEGAAVAARGTWAGAGAPTAGAGAAAGPPVGPPGGSVGSLIVGAAEGLGGKLMRTVSFLGWTLPVSFFGGTAPPGVWGILSAITLILIQPRLDVDKCQWIIGNKPLKRPLRRSTDNWLQTPTPFVPRANAARAITAAWTVNKIESRFLFNQLPSINSRRAPLRSCSMKVVE